MPTNLVLWSTKMRLCTSVADTIVNRVQSMLRTTTWTMRTSTTKAIRMKTAHGMSSTDQESTTNALSTLSCASTSEKAVRLVEKLKNYLQFLGQAFVKCMQNCGRHRHHDKCPKELKCGVKKLPQNEFHQKAAECHKKQTPRRYEVCTCLKDAGMK